MEYSDTITKLIEDKKIYYGENVKKLIETITRTGSNINLDDNRIFGMHIHAFCWAFFTGVNQNKSITPEKWLYTDTFSLGTYYRDGGGTVADAMLLIALGELKTENFEESFTSNSGIREILNIISSFAEGGAKHILEIRATPGTTTYLDSPYHFFDEIKKRGKIIEPEV